MKRILKLSIADFKLIFRDPSLRAFLLLPFILFGLFVWFLPGMVERFEILRGYVYLFLILGIIENTQTFCFISSMVLIEEKETEVARVYGIVPLSRFQYLFSRMLFPYLITVILNGILIAVQPFFDIKLSMNLVISLFSALVVPVYVLGINSLAKNRIEGLIYIKAFNVVVLLPLAAFFVPWPFSQLFGILPTHWIFQAIRAIVMNEPWSMLFLAIGFVFLIVLLLLLSRRFYKIHFT